MKKLNIVSMALMGFMLAAISVPAFASTYSCFSVKEKINGLGLKSVKIEMDDENPNAIVALAYNDGAKKSYNADTEGDDKDGWNIEYSSGRIFLKNKMIQVYTDSVDTFSELVCR